MRLWRRTDTLPRRIHAGAKIRVARGCFGVSTIQKLYKKEPGILFGHLTENRVPGGRANDTVLQLEIDYSTRGLFG
jgi:hypothetical protein